VQGIDAPTLNQHPAKGLDDAGFVASPGETELQ